MKTNYRIVTHIITLVAYILRFHTNNETIGGVIRIIYSIVITKLSSTCL